MTSVLLHTSTLLVPPWGTRHVNIEVVYDKTYTIICTMHMPQGRGDVSKIEKYIHDIPYIPKQMLEMIKLIHFHESDPVAEKMFDSLSTIFNSTLHQTMQKQYETYKIDKLQEENKSLQLQIQELKEHFNDKKKYDEQTNKLTFAQYELLQTTTKLNKLEKELTTTQSIIQQLSQDLEDTTTELKMWESRCMQYEDELYDLQQEKNNSSLDTILESAIDELYL